MRLSHLSDMDDTYRGYTLCFEDDRETWERDVYARNENHIIHYPFVLHADSNAWKEDLVKAIAYLKGIIDRNESVESAQSGKAKSRA